MCQFERPGSPRSGFRLLRHEPGAGLSLRLQTLVCARRRFRRLPGTIRPGGYVQRALRIRAHRQPAFVSVRPAQPAGSSQRTEATASAGRDGTKHLDGSPAAVGIGNGCLRERPARGFTQRASLYRRPPALVRTERAHPRISAPTRRSLDCLGEPHALVSARPGDATVALRQAGGR